MILLKQKQEDKKDYNKGEDPLPSLSNAWATKLGRPKRGIDPVQLKKVSHWAKRWVGNYPRYTQKKNNKNQKC